MSFVHGKNLYVSLDGDNLSAYANACDFGRKADSHDVTTYGKSAHVYVGGLLDGTATISGIYDNTASTGPRPVVEPLVGTVVTLIHRPEGTGAGLPQRSVNVLVGGYSESSPVADMVTWSVDLQLSDEIDDTAQSI